MGFSMLQFMRHASTRAVAKCIYLPDYDFMAGLLEISGPSKVATLQRSFIERCKSFPSFLPFRCIPLASLALQATGADSSTRSCLTDCLTS